VSNRKRRRNSAATPPARGGFLIIVRPRDCFHLGSHFADVKIQ
jgi:hypothetical protein